MLLAAAQTADTSKFAFGWQSIPVAADSLRRYSFSSWKPHLLCLGRYEIGVFRLSSRMYSMCCASASIDKAQHCWDCIIHPPRQEQGNNLHTACPAWFFSSIWMCFWAYILHAWCRVQKTSWVASCDFAKPAVTLLSTADKECRILHVRLAQQTYHNGKEHHYYYWECIARDSENQLC